MSVDVKRLPQSQVELAITVEPTELQGAMNKAYSRLAGQVSIPGFRKGKAPRAMVERVVGPVALFQEAVDIAVGEAYERALTDHDLQPLGQPHIHLEDGEKLEPDPSRPLTFTATVPVQPSVILGDYRSLRLEPPKVEIGAEEVDRVLNRLQEEQAPWQAVDDQPAEDGNQVTMALKATIGDESLIDQESFESVVRADESPRVPIPQLSAHLRGSNVGQSIEYDVVLPDDYLPKEYAGQTMHVAFTVQNIERKRLPDLDDDFARSLGAFQTLDEVRNAIKQSIAAQREREALDEYINDVVQKVVDLSDVEVPQVLVDEEIDRMVADLRTQIETGRRMTLEQFLRIGGRTMEEYREQMRPAAEGRVRTNLVMDELGRRENVEVPAEEIERELLAMAGLPTLKNRDKRRVMTSPAVRERVATRLRRRYGILRLLQLVAPPTEEGAPKGASSGEPEASAAAAESVLQGDPVAVEEVLAAPDAGEVEEVADVAGGASPVHGEEN